MKIIRITPGLGNQMFQYAFILNYKLKEECIAFDLSPCKHNKKHNGFELENIFNIKEKKSNYLQNFKLKGFYFYINGREITFLKLFNKVLGNLFSKDIIFSLKSYKIEKDANKEFNFNKNYLEINNSVYFDGYFNSYKYFKNIKEEVQKVFTFPEFDDEENISLLKKIKESESISMHIRRGDYVGSNFDVCDKRYFEESFYFVKNKLENKDIGIFIFSDDVDWCKKEFSFLKDHKHFFVNCNKKENSYKDMQLMSECKHNIIPNSTFSWWGAYLNKNPEKIVIAPKYWFKNVKTSEDRCEKSWHLL